MTVISATFSRDICRYGATAPDQPSGHHGSGGSPRK